MSLLLYLTTTKIVVVAMLAWESEGEENDVHYLRNKFLNYEV